MILENLTLVIVLIFIGSLMKRSSLFPESTASVLNSFVLNISLPAIILVNIPNLPINSQMFYPIGIHWVALTIHLILLLLAGKAFKLSRSVLGALIVVSTLGNTAFIGIPMSKAFFGAEAIPFAILYDQLGSGIGFVIYGAVLLPFFTGGKKKSLKEVIVKLLTFPVFVALIIGFLLKLLPPMPSIPLNILKQLAGTLIPCAMIAVGYSMNYRLPKKTLAPLALGLITKLLVLPFIILFLVKGVGLKGLAVDVSILQSGMPPMVTAGVMASMAKLEEDLSVALVGFGLIFSFGSLVLIKYFI